MGQRNQNDKGGPVRKSRPGFLHLGFAATATKGTAKGISTALLAGVLFAGCATPPPADDAEARAEFVETNDPLEPLNRTVFEFNRGVDTLFLRPAATFYKAMMPPPVQELVHNFFNNLKAPVILLNDLLQGNGARAGDTIARFAINTTVGVLGFGDPATSMGFARHGEDFGQTLGVWGAGEGPYLVLPILGPSNPRDAVGRVVDTLTDPVWRWTQNTDREYIPYKRAMVEAVDARATNLEEINDMERTSLDYYAAVRSLYRQIRADQIRNQAAPTNNSLPTMGAAPTENVGTLEPMEDPNGEELSLAAQN